MTTTRTIDLHGVPLTITETGAGRPVLLLHGGGGPASVLPWAERLAEARSARVIVPVHPGFDGTARPERVATVRDLANLYAELLGALDLTGVTVVGNSIGGWVAAELAALMGAGAGAGAGGGAGAGSGAPRVESVVLVDAVGLVLAEHPYPDFFALTPSELARLSYHDPARFGIDPARLPAEARARMLANRPVIAQYGGDMTDVTLGDRLPGIAVPTLAVWGSADHISEPAVGEAFAAAIPGGRFELIPESGHLPQIETPERLIELVWDFAEEHGGAMRAAVTVP